MSSEEHDNELPAEPAPGAGSGSGPSENAPGSSEHPDDRLGEELGQRADNVTQELRDLQNEMMPPEEPRPVAPEPPAPEPIPASQAEPEPSALPTGETSKAYRAPAAGSGFVPEGTDDDRLMSMLAWLSMVILQLPVVSIIQLLSENTKNRPFQRHHAITSLLFWAASAVYEILATVVFIILTTVTLGCGAICLWVIFFVPHALALYYAFQAYGGKRVELPYLSNLARQQGWM